MNGGNEDVCRMLGVFEIAASGGCARVCVRVRARCPSPKGWNGVVEEK